MHRLRRQSLTEQGCLGTLTMRRDLEAKGIEPSPVRLDEHGGKRYLVFFAREPHGVCFCFGQPA
jgi:hypothetical protein